MNLKPNTIYTLTPDAVALLQLCKSKSIDFQELGEIRANGATPSAVLPKTQRAAPKRKFKKTGVVTRKGVKAKFYRKDQHMGPRTYLAQGTRYVPEKATTKRAVMARAVIAAMTTVASVAGGKVPVIRRDEAVKLVHKLDPKLKSYAPSAMISLLYKLGFLKVVL